MIEKYPKSRAEIESLVLHELQSSDNCEGAVGVSVIDWLDRETGANWTVATYDIGTSSEHECDLAIQRIVPRLQRFYELVQKH